MLRPDRDTPRVYLHRAPVDMRKQIDGLVLLAKEVIQQDPASGALFAFINARRNKLKLLVWERNGFVVWYKRLERDKFHWPRRVEEAVVTLSDGYDVWRMKPHEALHFSVFS
jgi:transposase